MEALILDVHHIIIIIILVELVSQARETTVHMTTNDKFLPWFIMHSCLCVVLRMTFEVRIVIGLNHLILMSHALNFFHDVSIRLYIFQ
jgi:hypothetical protein